MAMRGGSLVKQLCYRARQLPRMSRSDALKPNPIFMTRWALSSLTAVVTLLCVRSTAHAERAADVAIVFRVLAYDSNLKARNDNSVTIAIAYRPEDSGSCARMVQASVGEATFAGIHVRLVPSPYASRNAFESSVVAAGAAAIYVCSDLEDATGAISTVSRKNSMLTLCTLEAGVRAGLSVGVAIREERRRLLVNLPATRAEGAHLSPALLQVAEVIQ
jgi:hypothetical protein